MSTTKVQTHTPGPWRATGGRYIPIVANVNGKDAQIGRAESFGQISDEECEANGALIAAAPDLLKACQQAEYAFRVPAGTRIGCEFLALTMLREAIAKAEGR